MIHTATKIKPHPNMEDSLLAQHARTSAEAFAALYQRHVTRVYRYHMAHVGNVHDAEDLTSQTFMAALEGIKSYRGAGPFAAWLMGIASRKRALFFRGRRPEVPLDEALQVRAGSGSVEQVAERRLSVETIVRSLRLLSPDRADALVLFYFSGLSIAEAAQTLGKSEASLKMLVSRGLQDLRERTTLRVEMQNES